MSVAGISITEDLGGGAVLGVAALAAVALVLLVFELRSRDRGGLLVVATGFVGVALFAGAVLRPAKVSVRGTTVGPRVVVLVDESRRLLIPTSDGTRRSRALAAIKRLAAHFKDARLSILGFGEGKASPLPARDDDHSSLTTDSDLSTALSTLTEAAGERPSSVIVVSDGRLSSPSSDAVNPDALGKLGVPVHTVKLEEHAPADASIRSVRAAGAAVAHQPLALTVEVGCSGGLSCRSIPVTITELGSGVDSVVLATGEAKIEDGIGKVELEVTLDRAGARVLQVSIEAPAGDKIPENDSRFLTFSVTRDRIRLLHLAGRPTYDVRALRRWLKNDEAVDVVAFFILREGNKGEDDPNADEHDLALIEFPVNELFTVHLPSFDAVILQDIDAVRYKLTEHLERLTRYVQAGGGLIMVGGPSSFGGGNYAETPIDAVLPVEQLASGEDYDPAPFVPSYTEAGRAAPITRALRELLGDELPIMHGVNLLGQARPGSIVLWDHPRLKAGPAPMPVLALGEAGDGRSIALAVDDTHELAFSEFAEKVAGRAYGALWDGLLGWLMRDPRYEAARVEVVGDCIAGEPGKLRVTRLPGMRGAIDVELDALGLSKQPPVTLHQDGKDAEVELTLPKLAAGGYTARVRIGAAPPTRHDFACEPAGPAFSDSRPDPERLERIATVSGGRSVDLDAIDSIPVPTATEIAAERHVAPVLPPWAWALSAAVVLGAHWVSRRLSGLS